MQITYPSNVTLEMLQDAIGVGGAFAGAKMALFEGVDPIQPDTAFADLPPAVFTGYAPQGPVVWLTPHYDSNGVATVFCQPFEWQADDSAAPSVVQTIGILNTAGDRVLAFGRLDDPLSFASVNDVHLIAFPLSIGQPGQTVEEVYP